MYTPSCTYRIQFNNQFTFKKLEKVIPYLQSLGIGCVYASPVFESTPGSNHGYDVTDSRNINREIGTLGELTTISAILQKQKIGWIQDIVPNHMAFHPRNTWLMDVLKSGRNSAYSRFFDIDWDHPVVKNKLMVPILGKQLKSCLESKEIRLVSLKSGLYISYYDFNLPVNKETGIFLKENFRDLDNGSLAETVSNDLALLQEILSMQQYELTYWQDSSQLINYRRFFSINGLISLKMEIDEVFDQYHELILQLAENGMFSGLRVDHIDGLRTPASYLERLRSRVGKEKYLVVEKILKHHERLDENWPVEGSTGYDFLAIVNNLFTNSSAMPLLKGFYREITGSGFSGIDDLSPENFILQKKSQILNASFQGDLDNISRLIINSGLIPEHIAPGLITEAVGIFLVLCPVYRIYSERIPLITEDAKVVADILDKAKTKKPALKNALNALGKILLDQNPVGTDKATEIFTRMMQFTGPLMAKGIEDTAMYAWTSFIAHNEVGDAIDASGLRIQEFHKIMDSRRKKYPYTMNATSTHDTKRGEDIRARLNVISDLPDEWVRFIRECIRWNEYRKKNINGKPAPDYSEEYLIYQTLLGSLPMSGKADDEYLNRLSEYFTKVLREAKINSDWNKPDTEYEKAVNEFVLAILHDNNFMKHLFIPFFNRLKHYGHINSLSQVVLKCTCPGIPDFYQGSELWDFSLVDPDNRRPVNYRLHEDLHHRVNKNIDKKGSWLSLNNQTDDGSLKMRITHLLMKERLSGPDFWIDAEYLPLHVYGDHRENVLAFARRKEEKWYLIIVPLHMAEICHYDMGKNIPWKNTRIELPSHAPVNWTLLWDNSEWRFINEISLDGLFKEDLPLLLKGHVPDNHRASGILLHVTSLPGKFGSGNIGNVAFDFVDFLSKSGQKYWQILPFNPTGISGSPYSSSSAFAGNTIFLDPEKLYYQHYIARIPGALLQHESDFRKSRSITDMVISQAFQSFILHGRMTDKIDFERFLKEQSYWLEDFVLFSLLKKEFAGKSWNEWPEEYRNRNNKSLKKLLRDHVTDSGMLKFGQYLFHKHFMELRRYADSFGIGLIGDIPVYVAHDSADVWSHPQYFDLDSGGKMLHIAGVPPDFFSKSGQLWNMPIYNWEGMKKDQYEWWKKRIARNLEYCTLLRLDHFRGFSAYWSIPAGDKTARKGEWIKGPAKDFFVEMKKEFPAMPFIAEDLGDIDEKVYKLRDDFKLPGMKVLQFAFNAEMPWSVHIPHNHSENSIVYTGTHDNNTSRGWYKETADKQVRNRLWDYTGRKVTEDTVSWDLLRVAYASVSRIAVVPMQDILDLNGDARLNTPAKAKGNWRWKMQADYYDEDLANKLCTLAATYGRI